MKTISELKQGDRIYDVDDRNILRYIYLCVHPTGRGKYHILIDSYEEPTRIYETRLQEILNKNINNYSEGRLFLIKRLKERIEFYKSKETIKALEG